MSVYRLIDTHAHLEEIKGLGPVLTEARAANIMAIIAVGSDYESNQQVLQLARVYKGFIYPALGLHPWSLKDAALDRDLAFIETHIEEAIAIGEVGLDYHKRVRERAAKDTQQHALSEILKIARKHNKPAIIHSRYAWRDSLDSAQAAQLEKAVFHWYTGPSSVLKDIIGQGYFISATPAVEYHEEHRRAVKATPLEKLLLETDCPVVYRRGSEFEYESRPADMLRSMRGAATLKGVSEAQIAEGTTANALSFFRLQD